MKKKRIKLKEGAGEYGLGSFYPNNNIMNSINQQEKGEFTKEFYTKNNTPIISTEIKVLKSFIFDEIFKQDMSKYINDTNKDKIIINWEFDPNTIILSNIFKNDTNNYKIIEKK